MTLYTFIKDNKSRINQFFDPIESKFIISRNDVAFFYVEKIANKKGFSDYKVYFDGNEKNFYYMNNMNFESAYGNDHKMSIFKFVWDKVFDQVWDITTGNINGCNYDPHLNESLKYDLNVLEKTMFKQHNKNLDNPKLLSQRENLLHVINKMNNCLPDKEVMIHDFISDYEKIYGDEKIEEKINKFEAIATSGKDVNNRIKNKVVYDNFEVKPSQRVRLDQGQD